MLDFPQTVVERPLALDLYEELVNLVQALDAARVPYALAGGLALAVHGVARATTDIDLLVRPADAGRLSDVARSLGYTFEAQPMHFADGMEVRRLTRIEAGESMTLDLLLVHPGIEDVWASRGPVTGDFGPLWVVSRDGLIRMKLSAGRARDLADIERLKEIDR